MTEPNATIFGKPAFVQPGESSIFFETGDLFEGYPVGERTIWAAVDDLAEFPVTLMRHGDLIYVTTEEQWYAWNHPLGVWEETEFGSGGGGPEDVVPFYDSEENLPSAEEFSGIAIVASDIDDTETWQVFYSDGDVWANVTPGGTLQVFSGLTELDTAFPADANGGKYAVVFDSEASVYTLYLSDGDDWNPVTGSGGGGGPQAFVFNSFMDEGAAAAFQAVGTLPAGSVLIVTGQSDPDSVVLVVPFQEATEWALGMARGGASRVTDNTLPGVFAPDGTTLVTVQPSFSAESRLLSGVYMWCGPNVFALDSGTLSGALEHPENLWLPVKVLTFSSGQPRFPAFKFIDAPAGDLATLQSNVPGPNQKLDLGTYSHEGEPAEDENTKAEIRSAEGNPISVPERIYLSAGSNGDNVYEVASATIKLRDSGGTPIEAAHSNPFYLRFRMRADGFQWVNEGPQRRFYVGGILSDDPAPFGVELASQQTDGGPCGLVPFGGDVDKSFRRGEVSPLALIQPLESPFPQFSLVEIIHYGADNEPGNMEVLIDGQTVSFGEGATPNPGVPGFAVAIPEVDGLIQEDGILYFAVVCEAFGATSVVAEVEIMDVLMIRKPAPWLIDED